MTRGLEKIKKKKQKKYPRSFGSHILFGCFSRRSYCHSAARRQRCSWRSAAAPYSRRCQLGGGRVGKEGWKMEDKHPDKQVLSQTFLSITQLEHSKRRTFLWIQVHTRNINSWLADWGVTAAVCECASSGPDLFFIRKKKRELGVNIGYWVGRGAKTIYLLPSGFGSVYQPQNDEEEEEEASVQL